MEARVFQRQHVIAELYPFNILTRYLESQHTYIFLLRITQRRFEFEQDNVYDSHVESSLQKSPLFDSPDTNIYNRPHSLHHEYCVRVLRTPTSLY